jgi:hypothetical protein
MMNGDEVDDIKISDETKASIAKLNSLKPISELLNFNSERDLMFDPEREWNFSLDRDLNFDMERELSFDADRDIHFGHNSIFFRGYLCPSCKRQVPRDTTACSVCGATYTKPIRYGWRDGEGPSQKPQAPMESVPKELPPDMPRAHVEEPVTSARFRLCPLCKMKNPMDALYCVECGNMIESKSTARKVRKGGV